MQSTLKIETYFPQLSLLLILIPFWLVSMYLQIAPTPLVSLVWEAPPKALCSRRYPPNITRPSLLLAT